jgi:hypothetical protein
MVLAFLLVPAPAFALILLSFHAAPGAVLVVGEGTANAVLNFGSVSAFEPLPLGVSRSVGSSSYTLSTTFGVRVVRLVSLSATYTLRARLQSAQALSWQVDGVTMSTSETTVATGQPFGLTVPHTVAFEVPFNHPAGPVTTVLEVIAIAN